MISNLLPPRRDWPPMLIGAGIGVLCLTAGVAIAVTWPAWAGQTAWPWIAAGLLVGAPLAIAGALLHVRGGQPAPDRRPLT